MKLKKKFYKLYIFLNDAQKQGNIEFQTIFIGWVPRNFFKKVYITWLLSKLTKPMTRPSLAMNAYWANPEPLWLSIVHAYRSRELWGLRPWMWGLSLKKGHLILTPDYYESRYQACDLFIRASAKSRELMPSCVPTQDYLNNFLWCFSDKVSQYPFWSRPVQAYRHDCKVKSS